MTSGSSGSRDSPPVAADADYWSLGYLLTRRIAPPAARGPVVLPDPILTASRDLARFAPGPWALRWVSAGDVERERREACETFGIAPEALSKVLDWATRRFDRGAIGWQDVCLTVETAREFVRRFLPADAPVVLLGLGLRADLAPAIEAMEVVDRAISLPGHLLALRQRRRLAPGGTALGYEPVGVLANGAGRYSWLDEAWEAIAATLGIVPGPFGLVPQEAQATAIAHRCATTEDAWQEIAHVWLPWLLVEYPLRASGQAGDEADQ